MSDARRFTVAMRGYDRAQVDAHCTRIEATLAGTAGTLAITAEEAVNPAFTIGLRGYDPQEVEAWVRDRATRLPSGGASGPSWTESVRRRHDVLQLAERPAGERFPRVRLREGYDLAEVDAFVEHIRATLGTALTADEVRNKQFTTVRLRLGYDMQPVDEWLDAVQLVAEQG